MGFFGRKRCNNCGAVMYHHPGTCQYSCSNCRNNRDQDKKIKILEERIKNLESK